MTERRDPPRRPLTPETAILDLMCTLTGWSVAVATVAGEHGADDHEDVVAASSGFTGPTFHPQAAIVMEFPVASVEGPFRAGAVWLADPVGAAPSAEVLDQVRTLATAASVAVLRADAERARRRRAAIADPALMETLQAVRAAEDQVGNSLAVVLGWLRILSQSGASDDAAPGGVQIAIRRLEEVQGMIAGLLRSTAANAIEEHARHVVSVRETLDGVGLPDLAPSGDDVLILANRGHLIAFLTSASAVLGADSAVLGADSAVTEDAWLIPFAHADRVGSAVMLSLHASGGTMASYQRGHAAAWRRAPRQAMA